MRLCANVLGLLFLQPLLSSPRPLTSPSKGCPGCKGKASQLQTAGDMNVSTLNIGEPCGVYTLNCAKGLRCAPTQTDPRPLRALLEGRGVCSNVSIISWTQKSQTADPAPTENPEEAPCRKLLTTLIRGLDSYLFMSHHDIYMPNCDKRGFFRKKQCWSSRGKQRGRCWCVDESGIPVTSHQDKGLTC
ncbi:insulin-like growth factor-binding protein 6b [Stigmatopora nigra]